MQKSTDTQAEHGTQEEANAPIQGTTGDDDDAWSTEEEE